MNKYVETLLALTLGTAEVIVNGLSAFGDFLFKKNEAVLNKLASIPNPKFLDDLVKSSPIETTSYEFKDTTRGKIERYVFSDNDQEKFDAINSIKTGYPFL